MLQFWDNSDHDKEQPEFLSQSEGIDELQPGGGKKPGEGTGLRRGRF